ncbi:hypothetical protein [Sphingomonas sp. UNC305MFCol5.2]|uniref:hypothetical protein n=1 Tax=Sphingomonas sp. UNC305MFCol5.2 TaxID=1449076 RepID=UPI0004A72A20|nr:hypothetical protein [Sphingomonas sp. UNC305MFCol5.2]
MRNLCKTLLTLVACFGLSGAASADTYECTELQRLWGIAQAAQSAENDYNYYTKLGDAYEAWLQCQRIMAPGGGEYAMRECTYQYEDTKNTIENEYQLLHNEALISNAAYYDYLNYVFSQGIQCQL